MQTLQLLTKVFESFSFFGSVMQELIARNGEFSRLMQESGISLNEEKQTPSLSAIESIEHCDLIKVLIPVSVHALPLTNLSIKESGHSGKSPHLNSYLLVLRRHANIVIMLWKIFGIAIRFEGFAW